MLPEKAKTLRQLSITIPWAELSHSGCRQQGLFLGGVAHHSLLGAFWIDSITQHLLVYINVKAASSLLLDTSNLLAIQGTEGAVDLLIGFHQTAIEVDEQQKCIRDPLLLRDNGQQAIMMAAWHD